MVVIAVLLWSTGGLFIKLTTLDAYQVTFFRSLLAGITVLIFATFGVLYDFVRGQKRRPWLRINAFGIMASVIYATLLFLFVWATKHTTAANAIFLQYTAPIYILIFAPFIIGEKFHWRDLITIIFCIGGMSLFFVGKLEITDYQGNLAALLSGVFLGLYIMLLRHPRAVGSPPYKGGVADATPLLPEEGWPKAGVVGDDGVVLSLRDDCSANDKERTTPPFEHPSFTKEGNFEQSAGTQASLPASAADLMQKPAREQGRNTQRPGYALADAQASAPMNPVITVIYGNFLLALLTLPSGIAAVPTMTLTDAGAVGFLGVFQIGIAYILFIKGVTGGTRPLDASIIGFIEPLLNPVWVFLFVGEQPSQWAILGGAIIIVTVVAHTLNQYRSKAVTLA